MKAFAFWFAGLLVVFGGLALIINAMRDTERVFVVVDSSFPMTEVWDQVPSELDRLDDERFTEFALATEKNLVHTWGPALQLAGVNPFAPCDFGDIESYTEISEADEMFLITTGGSCETGSLGEEWSVILLEP